MAGNAHRPRNKAVCSTLTHLANPNNETENQNIWERAKAQVLIIERETRPRSDNAHPLSKSERLAQDFAAAFKPGTTTIEELQSADGMPITKVSGPMGTYCMMRDTNRPGAGRDPFRDSDHNKAIKCPH